MNPDELKRAWQAQDRAAIDAEGLADDLRRRHRQLAAMVRWRDVREIGVALALVPLWIVLGVRRGSPWTWYLAVPALLWIAGFLLVNRMRHGRRPPEPDAPLRRQLEASRAQVDHQIWLLRNVSWWYLLPIALAMLAFFAESAWRERAGGWPAALALSGVLAIGGALLGGVYRLNQDVVRTDLEPRLRELDGLLAGLADEPPGADGP